MKGLLSMLLALVSLTFPCRECLSGDESHRVYACGKSDGNELALTFDDGPHPEYTPRILDILKNNGIKATFRLLSFYKQNKPLCSFSSTSGVDLVV